MSSSMGSNDCFSHGAIPPDLSLPQDPNEYLRQLHDTIAAQRTEIEKLRKRVNELEQDSMDTVSYYARLIRELRARLGLPHAPDVNLPPEEFVNIKHRLATAQARAETFKEQMAQAVYNHAVVVADLKRQLAEARAALMKILDWMPCGVMRKDERAIVDLIKQALATPEPPRGGT